MSVVVCDLGGTHLRCGLANMNGTVYAIRKQRVASFLEGLTPAVVAERVVQQIADYCRAMSDELPASAPIILAFPGPVDQHRTIVAGPPLFGDASNQVPDLASLMTHRTGRRVHILNDLSAAAWGLSLWSEVPRFLVVTVSSGIGSKLFDRAHSSGVLDDLFYAGEIGHHVVDFSPDAPLCDCGGRGHLGAIASGRGVERLARRLRHDQTLTNPEHIVPALHRSENWALDVLDQTLTPLATTLLAITLAVGLAKIYLIGGFAQSVGTLYANRLNALLAARAGFNRLENRFNTLAEVVMTNDELALNGAALFATKLVQ